MAESERHGMFLDGTRRGEWADNRRNDEGDPVRSKLGILVSNPKRTLILRRSCIQSGSDGV